MTAMSQISAADEIDNSLSEYRFALKRDCPGKTWWNLEPMHPAIYRALQIDPTDYGAVYACAPFRLLKSDGQARVAAAYPAPMIFDPPDPDWLAIEAVIVWNPADDTAELLGDTTPQIVGDMTDETNRLFASPRAFFQSWAVRRAAHAVERQTAIRDDWHIVPKERDVIPGALMIGDPAKIQWHPRTLPADLQCVGVDPKTINRAILRSARLPRARAA